MNTPNNEIPSLGRKCGFNDYLEALSLSATSKDLQDPQITPNITITVSHQVASTTAATTGSQAPEDPESKIGGESGNEADGPSSLGKYKPRRRSTGGATSQGGHPRQGGKRDRTADAQSSTDDNPPKAFLKVPQEADGSASEAEMSGVDEYYRPKTQGSRKSNWDLNGTSPTSGRRGGPSRARGIVADSSEGCDDGECGIGGKAEVFDSDLESAISDLGKAAHAKKMRKWKSLARDKFEKMLIECIVNTGRLDTHETCQICSSNFRFVEEIPPDYKNIHIDRKIIDKLERVTKMSLLMPKAFSSGVLAGNKVTGAVLWGPPGTGKSLLAKAVARQSGFNMILASTAELWQKCHGDDEKVIKALFSMARKIHPTIVFIDEADAMLGSRKAGEKRHIRAMLNQFLMEWDGLMSGKDSPFILLATNRPFDLDPAVLRRAPMQIHLDIPTPAQRHGILTLLLEGENGETLASDVTIERLVKLTPRYTGSDLKNMCVTAATECVGETKPEDDSPHRVLQFRHFKSAMANIKATGLSKTMQHELRNFGKSEGAGGARNRDDE